MSNGGTWEPPRPGSTPPESHPAAFGPAGGSPFAPPRTPASSSAPLEVSTPQPTRSRGTVIAAAVGVVALVGAGVFAVSRVSGDNAAGGAATPEEAGLAMLTALENEDILGIVDVLLPSEQETLREPSIEIVDELRRLEVLSGGASLSDVGGLDIQLEDEAVTVEPTNAEDVVNLEISASGTAAVNGGELPIGDFVLDNAGGDPSELTSDAQESTEVTFPMTAVRKDGRWYLSAFYTVAELARMESSDAPDIPTPGVTPAGGDSPGGAIEVLLASIAARNLKAFIAALNPHEFEVLQRYAPLFIDDAQTSLGGEDLSITIDGVELRDSGGGDRRSVVIEAVRVEVESADEVATVELADGCWTVTTGGESTNTCELAEQMPQLDEVFEDPQPIQDVLDSLANVFAAYEDPGLIVEQVDGQWYFSPIATGAEQVLAVMRSLDRENIEDLIAAFEQAAQQVDDGELQFNDDLFGDLVPAPAEEPTPSTVVPESTVTGGTSPTTDSIEDAGSVCYEEADAVTAAACFQTLVVAGEVEPDTVPYYLRFPECGLADLVWSAEYFSLPDSDFVTIVEGAAPCFQDLIDAGELDELELPPELTAPECLAGRNLYEATGDDAYFDAFTECADD